MSQTINKLSNEYLSYLQGNGIYILSKSEIKTIHWIIPYLSNEFLDIKWTIISEEKFLKMMIWWSFFRIEKNRATYIWYTIEDYYIVNKNIYIK